MRKWILLLILPLLLPACVSTGGLPTTPRAEVEPTAWDNGQWIAFVSGRDGNWEIYRMRPDGSQLTNLTDNPAPDSCPSWSPDGQWIAFESTRDGNFEIYKMRADGSQVIRVTNDPGQDGSPSWSPDGNSVAFVCTRDGSAPIALPGSDICKVAAGGGETQNLTDNPGPDADLSWSPDGRRIAFVSDRDGNWEIYVMNADGSEVTRLTDDPGADRAPSWSPDGNWVYFVSSRGVDTGIYRMTTDGTEVARLTLHSARAPTWSPDGEWIAFVSKSGPYPYTYAVFKVRADGTEATRLTESGGCGSPDLIGNDFDLSWSPDGDWIAFVSDCGPYTHDIFKVRSDGSEVTRLTHNSTPLICRIFQDLACAYYQGASDHAPAWAP